nr:hypothetical protein [Ktedonobacterales bacterium]
MAIIDQKSGQQPHATPMGTTGTTLLVLAIFTTLTAIQGAIFVVPFLPHAWLHQGPLPLFTDYTIPALALGLGCGGSALAACVGILLAHQRSGAVLAAVAGACIVSFELVEIAVVGFTPALQP